MLFDTHIHTAFSFDSKLTLAEAVSQAKTMEVGLCITDHLDFNMTYPPFDPTKYYETYYPLRSKALFIGTECGMDPRFSVKSEEYLKITSPDFTLGSVHTISDDDIYDRATYKKYSKEDFWHAYFRQIMDSLETHPFIDSLGHLDYPARLVPYGESSFDFRQHEKGLIPIFEYLIAHDLALEFNLRRFSRETRAEFREFFSVYRELGGKYITLGSDSHDGRTVGAKLRDGYELLKEVELKPVHFESHEVVTDHLF